MRELLSQHPIQLLQIFGILYKCSLICLRYCLFSVLLFNFELKTDNSFLQLLKMKEFRNYFTFVELQQICVKMGLCTEGSKPELIARILDCIKMPLPPVLVEKQSSNIVRTIVQKVSFQPSNFVPKTPAETSKLDTGSRFKNLFRNIFSFIGFFGGLYAIAPLLEFFETMEISVKRSWF